MKVMGKVGYALLVLLFIATAVSGVRFFMRGDSREMLPGSDPQADQMDVVRTCQDSVKRTLKDPDSAEFDGWSASRGSGLPPAGLAFDQSAGDLYYSARGMVNAKNGFGGYDGQQPYACDAVVTRQNIWAQTRPLDDPSG